MRALLSTLFSVVALGASGSAFATSCVLSPLEDVVRESSHIFIGKVTEIKYQGDEAQVAESLKTHCGPKLVTLKVLRTFKGKADKTSMVYSEDSCLGLGVNFETGKEYLVYGMPSDTMYEKTWAEVASLCLRTAPLDTPQTVADVQQLKALFK